MSMAASEFPKNVYAGVLSPGFGTGSSAVLWMSESAMLETSISVSQLITVSLPSSSGETSPLKPICNAGCVSSDELGAVCAVGIAWPSKTLVRNTVRFSKQLAQTLGFPAPGSTILVASLPVKSSPPEIAKLLRVPCITGPTAAVIHECERLTLQVCEETFQMTCQAADTASTFNSPLKGTPERGNIRRAGSPSPLRNSTPDRSGKTVELSSAAVRSCLKAGSRKMKEVVEKLAARWLFGRLLLPGNIVVVPVCGRECFFHVKAGESFPQQGPTDDSLSAKMKHLSLGSSSSPDHLYYVSQRTSLCILVEEEKSSQESLETTPAAPSEVKHESGTTCTYGSLGGLSEEIVTLKEIVDHSLLRPELLQRFGLKRTKGVLLHGPPGTGKTSLAQAVAAEAGVKLFVINGPEIVSEYYGESEAALKAVFSSAAEHAPSVVFIDELDAITPERKEDSEELGQRMIATLLTLMDGVHKDGVLVIAATNRPESIDPALRRHGRFDYEIEIGVPTPQGRLEILEVHLSRMKHNLTRENIQAVASATHGFVGADLLALCNEAALTSLRRYVISKSSRIETSATEASLDVLWEDVEQARGKIRPSAMREVILEVPKVRWSDIGGQSDVKQQLKEIVEWPHKHQESFARIGTTPPKGVLLYGPPGCSKTLMARAVAAEAGLNFIAVKGPELFSKWVGESEKAVRALFSRARAAAPSIVFFDEIDGLAVTRSSGHGGGDGVSVEDRVMSQLLIELDGVSPRNGVSVVAATNRPDKLDPALLRPGRFDRLIYVGRPDREARKQIFDIHLRNTPCGRDVLAEELAARTESYTGADIAAVCREAALAALEENLMAETVRLSHFEDALTRVLPSKCNIDFKKYNKVQRKKL